MQLWKGKPTLYNHSKFSTIYQQLIHKQSTWVELQNKITCMQYCITSEHHFGSRTIEVYIAYWWSGTSAGLLFAVFGRVRHCTLFDLLAGWKCGATQRCYWAGHGALGWVGLLNHTWSWTGNTWRTERRTHENLWDNSVLQTHFVYKCMDTWKCVA